MFFTLCAYSKELRVSCDEKKRPITEDMRIIENNVVVTQNVLYKNVIIFGYI